MRTALFLSIALLVTLASGCERDEYLGGTKASESVAAKDLTPEQLGELGAKIKKAPDQASELLSAHGLTQESFEAAIRKVTENPEASKRYTEAFNKASA